MPNMIKKSWTVSNIDGQGITVYYSIYSDSSSNKKGKFLSGDEKIAEAHSWVGLGKREAAAL